MIDFFSLFSDHPINFSDKESRGWINVSCPYCHDTGLHLGFNISGGYCNCFRCGGHDLVETLSLLLRLTPFQIKNLIKKYTNSASIKMAHSNKPEEKEIEIVLPGEPLSKRHRQYLSRRKFDPDFLMEKYGIKGTGIAADKWCWRIIIPIYYRNRLVAFQGRDITGQAKNKYESSGQSESIINPKRILYNLDNCKKDSVIVVEGIFDCWRIGDDCVATLGTSLHEEQVILMVRRFKEVFLLFDPEEEAQNRAEFYGEKLASFGMVVYVINTELDRDPGDMNDKEVEKLRRSIGI